MALTASARRKVEMAGGAWRWLKEGEDKHKRLEERPRARWTRREKCRDGSKSAVMNEERWRWLEEVGLLVGSRGGWIRLEEGGNDRSPKMVGGIGPELGFFWVWVGLLMQERRGT